MELEVWRKIKTYEDFYEISSFGRVRSLDRLSNNKIRKGKLCKPFMRNNYWAVALSKQGFVKQFSIHRLVAEAFIENSENKPTVNHIDGNKLNNTLSNLEWATQSEQILHAINKLGFIPHKVVCNYTNRLKQIRKTARLGYSTPQEVKEKISKSLSKRIKCISDNIEFNSLKEAVEYSGLPKSTFHRKLHKKELINNKKYEYI